MFVYLSAMTKTSILILLLLNFQSLLAQNANRYDIVITEIMADPTPQIGLPNNEWVELHNNSSAAINLQGWRLGDASSLSGPMPGYTLLPDSFVLICTSSAVAALSSYGKAISVTSFPSLDNDGDRIYLQSAQGKIIHAVDYNPTWYQNSIKASGGWTLEMIDPNNPCTGSNNWKASTDASGGTPGRKNSVFAINTDDSPPQLARTYSIDSVTFVAIFNEPVDSTSAANVSNYSFSNNIKVLSALPQTPVFQTVVLKLASPASKATVYTVIVNNIKDCKGNTIGVYNTAKAGVAQEAKESDLVINEILFNPKPGGYDYVEVYNRSSKVIDANKTLIATRTSSGTINSFKNFTEAPCLIFPGDYIVLTEDPGSLKNGYFIQTPEALMTVTLPSLANDKGTVVVTNAQGVVVDEVTYNEKWHFPLITNDEGVALERIDPSATSQDANNWHSAASSVGYGTPTYRNSQYKQVANGNARVELLPRVFSPDNDGNDDIAILIYHLKEPNFVANVTIFDAQGRPVKHLVKNALLSYEGKWTWDGLGEQNQKLPIGPYIVYTEIFNLNGKREQFKNTVVLARKMN